MTYDKKGKCQRMEAINQKSLQLKSFAFIILIIKYINSYCNFSLNLEKTNKYLRCDLELLTICFLSMNQTEVKEFTI